LSTAGPGDPDYVLSGSDTALFAVLSISSDGPARPLDRLFAALRATLTEVIERDAKLDWPDSNLIPKSAIVTWATQWFGYRVDRAHDCGDSILESL
ncbi:MAG: hypothetical protein ACKOOI_06010, partial [Pirellula sp.]